MEYRPEGTLGDVALPAGWAWERPETVPTVNNDGYAALYTPSDTANYDYSILQGWDEQTGTVRRVVPLVVAKAEPKVELPAVEAQEYEKGTKLGEILLPEGWAWAEQDAALRLGEKTYTAVYTPSGSPKLPGSCAGGVGDGADRGAGAPKDVECAVDRQFGNRGFGCGRRPIAAHSFPQ